jgi:SAM-dependent methyltransferase
VLGDDLGELLGPRIPRDHSRQVVADDYAGRYLSRDDRPAAPRVMDLGCGTGDSVDLFRRLDPAVRWVGVDLERSPEVDERVRDDAEFVTFDGVNLPFEDRSFDLVYCKQVLEHVRRPDPLIREVGRVLAPGGWFAGSTSQLEAFHSRSIFNHTPYGLTLMIEDAGMEVVELRPVIDGLTLVTWRTIGLPNFFYRWWGPRESPLHRVIEIAGRARRLDARTRNQIKLTLCGQFAWLARSGL